MFLWMSWSCISWGIGRWLRMSQSSAMDERISSLLAQADGAQRANKSEAFELLKKASQLQPHGPEVQRRWQALQSSAGTADIVPLLREYSSTGKEEDGRRVRQALQQTQLSADDATSVLDLLSQRGGLSETHWDEVTALALTTQLGIRKAITTHLTSNATEIFEQMFARGDSAFQAFTSIPYDSSLWHSASAEENRIAAQKDVFRLSIAKLMLAGLSSLEAERAVRSTARCLATGPEALVSVIDADVFDVVLSCLDIRREPALRSQALLAASKLLEATREEGEQFFATFITDKVASQTKGDLITAFSAAAAMFPIVPVVASKLFMTDGFVQQLVPTLERNSDDAASRIAKASRTLCTAALEMLSAACVDKACREAIKRYCLDWLQGLAKVSGGAHQALATLILAKISQQEDIESVTKKLSELVVQRGDDGEVAADQAIEGLAYTSLQPKVKEQIAANEKLLRQLTAALKERPANVAFGCLTIFANLSAYRPALSEEQKKMAQLKAYANSSKHAPEDPLDGDKHVTGRCRKLLDADVVPALAACWKQQQTASMTNTALIVRILLAVSREQKHRAKMAQQGAVKLLLQIKERISKTSADGGIALLDRNTSHALARLLISVNPAHVFTAAVPASSAVSALIPLLSTQQEEADERDLLPTFESLLALTNLASMDDPTARELLIRSAFDKLEDLLFSSTVLIQRASVELVCNLMASPSCVAKLADGSTDAKRRLKILLALADVEDLATRRAAGGALAGLTEWDAGVDAVLDQPSSDQEMVGKGVQALLAMCADESEEVRHRGLVCLGNVVGAPGKVGQRGAKAVKNAEGVEMVRESIKGTKSREVVAIGVEVLKKLG